MARLVETDRKATVTEKHLIMHNMLNLEAEISISAAKWGSEFGINR